jgi:hypothetical protein
LLIIVRWRFETWPDDRLLSWWRRTAHPDIQDTQVLFFDPMPAKSELVEMCVRASRERLGSLQFHELSDLIDAPLLTEVQVKPAHSRPCRLWAELGLN